MNMKLPFWKVKLLAEMNREEWESLCDGCGKCCLVKLEDEDTDELYITNVACRLLEIETCRCCDYEHRLQAVPVCLFLEADKLPPLNWLPETCAYRLLAEGKQLFDWHHLVSGNMESVHEQGMSVREYAQSEEFIHPDQLYDHIIEMS
jgi:uncharacterized protein